MKRKFDNPQSVQIDATGNCVNIIVKESNGKYSTFTINAKRHRGKGFEENNYTFEVAENSYDFEREGGESGK